MKIGVLGTGDVGRRLASGFISTGHEVKLGAREANNARAREWADQSGPKASAGTFNDAAAFGELVALGVLGAAAMQAIDLAGVANFDGKVVIDAMNPLEFPENAPPRLFVGHSDSLGEQVQRKLPKARVVKAFNIVGNPFFVNPEFPNGPPDMFICGNDEEAKKTVTDILTSFGWPTIDIGGIEGARVLEPMCILWVLGCLRTGNWDHAFKFLSK